MNVLSFIYNKIKKSRISIILKTLFSITLIIYLCYNINIENLSLLTYAIFPYILLCIFITTFSIFIMSIRWQILIKSFLNKIIPIKNFLIIISLAHFLYLPSRSYRRRYYKNSKTVHKT